mgnify:CR=1 FL=1
MREKHGTILTDPVTYEHGVWYRKGRLLIATVDKKTYDRMGVLTDILPKGIDYKLEASAANYGKDYQTVVITIEVNGWAETTMWLDPSNNKGAQPTEESVMFSRNGLDTHAINANGVAVIPKTGTYWVKRVGNTAFVEMALVAGDALESVDKLTNKKFMTEW